MSEKEDDKLEKTDGGNLTKRIVADLGRAIVTQQFTAAIPFPVEAELCRQYGVSRPVVREAVKMLTAKGLLRARQRAGTIVEPEDHWNLLDPDILKWMLEREFSIDLLIDFTDVRMSIEPRAAGLAAYSATGPQRQQIVLATERMFAAERGEDDPLEADIAFHTAVLAASNNRFLRQFTDLSETTLRFSIRRTNAYAGVARASAADHARVGEAIIKGEPQRAVQLMRELIQDALDLLLGAGGHPARPPI
ncbi:FadR/GntR family transcriptional regulator [Massilia horti]|uniref:FadR family transcriptional regulator n=1 Tax=Massilia horti TaxID=2562153 RepID=A0A4Y9T5D9_9BURK|nr:FadR/GntR family transcriptional regulator [Massilia horti]TFW32229.1 FadR family transcriptional regulator [Massilia horti]